MISHSHFHCYFIVIGPLFGHQNVEIFDAENKSFLPSRIHIDVYETELQYANEDATNRKDRRGCASVAISVKFKQRLRAYKAAANTFWALHLNIENYYCHVSHKRSSCSRLPRQRIPFTGKVFEISFFLYFRVTRRQTDPTFHPTIRTCTRD